MAWEQRRGRSYYYRKRRLAGRVRSEYVGGGLVGQIVAADDENERCERAAKRDSLRRTRRAEAEIDRRLAAAESAITAMTQATLVAAGYHSHKGQWRRKRYEHATTDDRPC